MNFKKIIAAAAACAAAVSMLAMSVSAYTIDKDLKNGWSVSTTVPAEEFDGATPDSVFTLTFKADPSVADTEGQNYWCIKPMINDTGWPFIDNFIGPELSENKDTYAVTQDMTEIKFKIPAEELEHVQIAGMAFMGHAVTLGELTFSNSETLAAPAAAAPAAGNVAAATDSSKGSPDTGIADVAAVAGLAIAAAAGIAVSRKRK